MKSCQFSIGPYVAVLCKISEFHFFFFLWVIPRFATANKCRSEKHENTIMSGATQRFLSAMMMTMMQSIRDNVYKTFPKGDVIWLKIYILSLMKCTHTYTSIKSNCKYVFSLHFKIILIKIAWLIDDRDDDSG